MGWKRSLSYQSRLFLLILMFSWGLMACFLAFQYQREKAYKAATVNARLQQYNLRIIDALDGGESPVSVYARLSAEMEGLRMTLIATDGRVLYDSSNPRVTSMENHRNRTEVRDALTKGEGFTIRRFSTSVERSYFYSAMRDDGRIVRTALPYTLSLSEVLEVDRFFLWFMLGVTLLISLMGFVATRRIGQNINKLRRFAQRLDRGESVEGFETFPRDELGEISSHIVRLYSRLQRATLDLEQEHRRTLYEEQEKHRIKKQLTNNINHELKTPVSSIHGYLETLLNTPDIPADIQRSFLEKCYAQSERLGSLLRDVSVITRMDDGGSQIDRERVDLSRLVHDVVDDVASQPAAAGIRFEVAVGEHVMMEGNASLLHSIFRNLLDNAVAYSGCDRVRVVLTEESDDVCYFTFSDNGSGVGAEHLSHLFERFYRVDKGRSRKMGGTGLGLSIVKNAVLFHGGHISVDNMPDGGLCFTFDLRKK